MEIRIYVLISSNYVAATMTGSFQLIGRCKRVSAPSVGACRGEIEILELSPLGLLGVFLGYETEDSKSCSSVFNLERYFIELLDRYFRYFLDSDNRLSTIPWMEYLCVFARSGFLFRTRCKNSTRENPQYLVATNLLILH